jgi:hypothetical protein
MQMHLKENSVKVIVDGFGVTTSSFKQNEEFVFVCNAFCTRQRVPCSCLVLIGCMRRSSRADGPVWMDQFVTMDVGLVICQSS